MKAMITIEGYKVKVYFTGVVDPVEKVAKGQPYEDGSFLIVEGKTEVFMYKVADIDRVEIEVMHKA